MRKLPFDDPGLSVPGSWRRSSGISSVNRNWTRLRRATLPPSPSQRTWPAPPRPTTAGAVGLPSSTVTGAAGDGLAEGAGWGLSWASPAPERRARARRPSIVQRAARAGRGAGVIGPPGGGRAWWPFLTSTLHAVQRGAVAGVPAVAAQPLAEDVEHAAHHLDVPRHQLREGLAVQAEQPRVLDGGDGGQPRLGIEQGQLAEDLLRPQLDDRARSVVDAHPSGDDDVEAVAFGPLLEDD